MGQGERPPVGGPVGVVLGSRVLPGRSSMCRTCLSHMKWDRYIDNERRGLGETLRAGPIAELEMVRNGQNLPSKPNFRNVMGGGGK